MAKRAAALVESAFVRLFLHDTLVQLYLGVLAAEAVIYSVPLMDPGTLTAFGASPFEIPFVATAAMAGFYGLRRIPEREERLFWTHLAYAMVFWLATLVWISLVPAKDWSRSHDVLVDASYLFFYSPILFALERKPHLPRAERQRDTERQLRWAGVTLLVVGWFAYFVVVPVLLDPATFSTSLTSSLLFVTIDIAVVIRATWRAWSCGSLRWRALYGTLAAAGVSLAATDGLDLARDAGFLVLRNGAATDLIWAIPPMLFVLAFRLREADLPRTVDDDVRDRDARRSLDPVRVGSFLVASALAFPLVHFVLHTAQVFHENLAPGHRLVVLVALVALASLAGVAYRVLERQRVADERARASLEARLREARKLEAVSRLAGVVADEFTPPLQVLSAFADRALDALAAGDPLRNDAQRASEQILRMVEFTRNLAAVSRQQRGRPIRVDLAIAVSDALPSLRDALGPSVRIECTPGPGAATVIDPAHLRVMLLDLATNARDAMPAGGRLRIDTGAVVLDAETAFPLAMRPGRYARLAVSDTGDGIPNEALAHIFEPFGSTKSDEPTAGLGLATLYAIVSQHGGCVNVSTKIGEGTSFEILLPAVQAAL
ncbi:MAG: ATP-binding protein [Acidobacteria bacterium]|nr:ATP-binding protein [Acidobacteriota bacterium]